MALHTPRLAKEQESSAFLLSRHGIGVPSGETVNRRVGEHECELEFGDRFAKHEEIDGHTRLDLGEYRSEQFPVLRVRIEESQGFLPDRLIAAASSVGERHSVTFPVVELTEGRTQCRVWNPIRAGSCEARHLDELRRGHVRLCLQQYMHAVLDILLKREPRVVLGEWKAKAQGIVERIAR